MNPTFIQDLEEILESFFAAGKTPGEYELLRRLEAHGHFDELATRSSQLLLFQKNFLCMHALYQIQVRWLDKGWYLSISPLRISLEKVQKESDARALRSSETRLASYFLNWDNYRQANEDSVVRLQANFIKQFQAWLNADDAYRILGLDAEADWHSINKRYRSLVQSAHPDKGGDSSAFHKIQSAYEQLKLKHQGH